MQSCKCTPHDQKALTYSTRLRSHLHVPSTIAVELTYQNREYMLYGALTGGNPPGTSLRMGVADPDV